jgi:hypothetical protein
LVSNINGVEYSADVACAAAENDVVGAAGDAALDADGGSDGGLNGDAAATPALAPTTVVSATPMAPQGMVTPRVAATATATTAITRPPTMIALALAATPMLATRTAKTMRPAGGLDDNPYALDDCS